MQASLPAGMTDRRDIFRQADFIEIADRQSDRGPARRRRSWSSSSCSCSSRTSAPASITLLAMPLSLLAAVLALKWSALTINSMSLGGLAIAIGALVDDAIIDVENVFRRLRENAQRPEAERLPVLEVVYRRQQRDPRDRSCSRRSSSCWCSCRCSSCAASRAGCCGRSASPTWSRCPRRWSSR